MGLLNYMLYENPLITYSINAVKYAACNEDTPKKLTKAELWNILEINTNYLRLVGVLGALAVIFGAYGAQSIQPNKKIDEHTKRIFDTANRYHFFHCLALIAVPFCRFPHAIKVYVFKFEMNNTNNDNNTGITMISGIILFCGTCYYESLTGNSSLRLLTPIGGSLLFVGWCLMLL